MLSPGRLQPDVNNASFSIESDGGAKMAPERKGVPGASNSAPALGPEPAAQKALSGSLRKRGLLAIVAVAALCTASYYGWRWWSVGRFEETTDNAYLQADKVVAAPKVGGYVAEVLVEDNQPVKQGETLARIDDREYRIALLQARADVEKAQAAIDGVVAALIQQQAMIAQARAEIADKKAALDFSNEEQKRYGALLDKGAGTVQRSHQATSDLLQKQAALDKANASYDASQKQADALRSLEAGARATFQRAEINLDQAKLNLEYTTIKAPIDGVVGDRSLRKGQFVQPGANLLTIVPMGKSIYLVANFKETQLGGMIEGQPASFTVDAYDGHIFHGRIDSFAPGTGSQFALLPPENATGNFTKIVQRVPVRIILDGDDPMIARLRPGLSAEATVDTRGEPRRDEKKSVALGENDERR